MRSKTPRLTEAQKRLVEANLALVGWLRDKWPQRWNGISPDDAEQIGRLALARAVLRFDPTRGAALGTYAVHAIRHAWDNAKEELNIFGKTLKYGDGSRRDPPRAGAANLWEPDSRALRNALSFVEEQGGGIEARDRKRILVMLLSRLNDAQRFVVILNVMAGLTGSAIATLMGLSRERVRQLRVESLKILKIITPGELVA